MSHPKSNLASDSLYLPKITENGIPIYDSVSKATSTYLIINKMWIQVFPLFILALSPLPALSTFTYGLISYAYYVSQQLFRIPIGNLSEILPLKSSSHLKQRKSSIKKFLFSENLILSE